MIFPEITDYPVKNISSPWFSFQNLGITTLNGSKYSKPDRTQFLFLIRKFLFNRKNSKVEEHKLLRKICNNAAGNSLYHTLSTAGKKNGLFLRSFSVESDGLSRSLRKCKRKLT